MCSSCRFIFGFLFIPLNLFKRKRIGIYLFSCSAMGWFVVGVWSFFYFLLLEITVYVCFELESVCIVALQWRWVWRVSCRRTRPILKLISAFGLDNFTHSSLGIIMECLVCGHRPPVCSGQLSYVRSMSITTFILHHVPYYLIPASPSYTTTQYSLLFVIVYH